MTKQRQQTGITGEQIACDFLQELGYGLVERNHRTRLGELDTITEYDKFLVFCEVKTSQRQRWNASVFVGDNKKIAKLRQLGEFYLSLKHLTHMQPRFDVIAVQLVDGKTPVIDHFINTF